MTLPKQYQWLMNEPGPRMLSQMLALYGTHEYAGQADNPIILAWAEECGVAAYKHDETAWCGLGMAICAKRAGWDYNPGGNALWALNWAKWGTDALKAPIVPHAALGDVLVFERRDGHGKLIGGHVTQYVGEDETHYHCNGANQGDSVSIVRKPKHPIVAIRRAPWRIAQPANVRVVRLSATGVISTKEF